MGFTGIPSKYCFCPQWKIPQKWKLLFTALLLVFLCHSLSHKQMPVKIQDWLAHWSMARIMFTTHKFLLVQVIPRYMLQFEVVSTYILISFCLRSKFWSNGNCKKIMEKICSALKFLQPLCSFPSVITPQIFKRRREKYNQLISLDCIFFNLQ